MPAKFRPGDVVIYKKQKHSTQPGPRAHDIAAAVQDGQFSYVVDKYWVVTEVRQDNTIVVRTRRGKQHTIRPDDPNLRRLNWWQRLWSRTRYPDLREAAE